MAISYEELRACVVLNRMVAGRSRLVIEYLREHPSAIGLLEKIATEDFLDKAAALQLLQTQFDADREIETAEKKGVRLLTFFDPGYPEALRHLSDPPVMLYAKGDFIETDSAALAVVGTRHPSFYGRAQAKRFSRELASKGLTIVSGLAQGIDQVAHEAALEISFGRTIAVLGCGIDVIYPKSSQRIYDAIAERGILLSEYALGAEPLAHHFPTRNRIISGLSLGVLVIEAHARSGSLITAHQAMEQGREVFAVPGPVDQLTSRGTNSLIKEGAMLTDNPDEVFEALAGNLWTLAGKESKSELLTPDAPSSLEEAALLDILAQGPKRFEEMLRQSRLSVPALSEQIIRLEIRKKIHKTSQGSYSLEGKNIG